MKTLLPLLALVASGTMFGPPRLKAEDPQASPIPAPVAALRVQQREEPIEPPPKRAADLRCEYLVTVADDFVVEIYHNGKVVPDGKRELLLDRFGASAEKVSVPVHTGDWLVFHVVQNRLRWGGSKYFAAAGCFAENEFGFASDPKSAEWSVCDDPAKAPGFIRQRNAGLSARASVIDVPWGEGDQFIKEYAGKDFAGQALWGRSPSTWIKYVAGGAVVAEKIESEGEPAKPGKPLFWKPQGESTDPAAFRPAQWPVQILSAIYGTGGKNADVTAKVKEHVETLQHMFAVNPKDLGADPNPYWNKGLRIVYMKDGVRREQHRHENEWVLAESFYGPQDAAELRTWLVESRWFGEQPDIQFHADQTFTSPGISGTHRWEATGANKLRLIWSGERTVDNAFDYTWSSFSEVGNARNVFHLQK